MLQTAFDSNPKQKLNFTKIEMIDLSPVTDMRASSARGS